MYQKIDTVKFTDLRFSNVLKDKLAISLFHLSDAGTCKWEHFIILRNSNTSLTSNEGHKLGVFKKRVLRTNLQHRGKRWQEVEQKRVMWKYILKLFMTLKWPWNLKIHTIRLTNALTLKLYIVYTQFVITPTCFYLSWSSSGRYWT